MLGVVLAVAVAALSMMSLRIGLEPYSQSDVLDGIAALLGWKEPLPAPRQTILELRIWRTLTSIGVGATLAISGGLLQGVFRNGLASPSVMGITAGATLGASLAVLAVGGYLPNLEFESGAGFAPAVVTLFSFLGALATAAFVTVIGSWGGRVSVPTLLLVGIAVNSCAAGLISAIQSLSLEDYEVAQAIFSWTFGNLDDRSSSHAAIVWLGLAATAAIIPFVALELDLLAGGEEDAAGLGVSTNRVKALALVGAALAAAVAVSVAGSIAFVGLIVPHILRLVTTSSHRALLPLCLLGGPAFLVGAEVLQRWYLGSAALQPGVMMSLVGGPFFLALLLWNRRRIQAW